MRVIAPNLSHYSATLFILPYNNVRPTKILMIRTQKCRRKSLVVACVINPKREIPPTKNNNMHSHDTALLMLLEQGVSVSSMLQKIPSSDGSTFKSIFKFLVNSNRLEEAFQVFQFQKKMLSYDDKKKCYIFFINSFCEAQMPFASEELLCQMKSEGIRPTLAALETVMLSYADNELFEKAFEICHLILDTGLRPETPTLVKLINASTKMEHVHEVRILLEEMKSKNIIVSKLVYSAIIFCYAKAGQLVLMKSTFEEMMSNVSRMDTLTVNIILQYHCYAGSLIDLQNSYKKCKPYNFVLFKETIREMALVYIQHQRFHLLGEFVRDIGLKRKDVGTLLWNLLLLSSSATFKMKNLQGDFLSMVESGFVPDLMTFNIRALAFSKMHMYWDLYVSFLHMQQLNVTPDLVTYSAVVDSYLDGKMDNKLMFAIEKMGMQNLIPVAVTDSLVYEALGKGEFQVFAENFVELTGERHRHKCTYAKLLRLYLKRHSRKGQLFWNH